MKPGKEAYAMSILTYNFESEYLKNNHEVTVILPDKPRALTP